jgi:hypothetical protein
MITLALSSKKSKGINGLKKPRKVRRSLHEAIPLFI